MTSATVLCASLAVLLLINFSVSDAASRVVRSPQFGGGFYRPGFGGGFGRPGFGGGFGRPGFGRPRFGGGSISISKSVSISRGGGGFAGSSANSAAFGK